MDIDFQAILKTYVAESEEHLVRMEESLIGLETYPEDQKFLEAIFRGAHTIKGNAAGLGFPKVSEFAHAFEELLQQLRNRVLPVTKETITLLLRSVDALRQMIPDAIAGAKEIGPEHQALLAQLINKNAAPAEKQRPPTPQDTKPSQQPVRRRRMRPNVERPGAPVAMEELTPAHDPLRPAVVRIRRRLKRTRQVIIVAVNERENVLVITAYKMDE